MNCPDRLRHLREKHGLTQKETANLIHIKPRTYGDYESGRLHIPLHRLITLAKYYDCSMDYISGASNVRREFPEI